MALTPEFRSAVSERNLLRIRIMLKDSLLVDRQFEQFSKMEEYAKEQGIDFWIEPTEELERAPKVEWDIDLMNLELTRLVNDFTRERLVYCQEIIEKVYRIITPRYMPKPDTSSVRAAEQSHTNSQYYSKASATKAVSGNGNDYHTILKSASAINKILRKNTFPEGDRIWTYGDIDEILAQSKQISAACENIKSRRR